MRVKKRGISFVIIIIVIIFAIFLIRRNSNSITKETTMCIANHSELYVQLGCHACEIQGKKFGNNYQYLNIIDCFFEREKCTEKQISATPTWMINGKTYIGVKDIETLKELTGCE